jgi:hypothetical protein
MPNEQHPLKVFLCYAPDDEQAVRELNARLTQDGVDAWFSGDRLLPGQNRDLEIGRAVRESDAVIVCLSSHFNRPGIQQREARLALDTAMEQPEGEIYIIPARLEECEIPANLADFQAVDLFRSGGYEKLSRSLEFDRNKKYTPATQAKAGLVKEAKNSSGQVGKPDGTITPILQVFSNLKYLADSHPGMKYFSLSILVILIVFLGRNIYQQVKGDDISTSTPTLTKVFTVTSSPTATDTPSPTSTATSTPTLTPVTPTVTSTSTSTHTATVIPPKPLGEDWMAGCISTLWQPYPSDTRVTDRGDGCWKEPVFVFRAEFGDLDFLADGSKNAPVEIHGLFALLPETGRVTFSIQLKDLNNADLWMGIFPENDIESDGLLMIIPAGDVKKRVFVQKDSRDYETITSTSLLEQGNGYSISFTFTENSAKSTINPSVFFTNSFSIPSSQKWLFLGYKDLRGVSRIQGRFFSFQLK